MRIMLAQINPTIGDLTGNAKKIKEGIHQARLKQAEVVVFPELSLSGYPPQDFLLLPHFIEQVEKHLKEIVASSIGITAIVGLPRKNDEGTEKFLLNSAAIIQDGSLIGYQDKLLLPTYDVFDERRYFEPSYGIKTWNIYGKKVAITICEDIWQHSELLEYTAYRNDPIADLIPLQPDVVLNLSASPYSLDKIKKRVHVSSKAASSLYCPLLLCNQVGGNDSLIFDGYSFYVDGEGQLIDHAKGFVEDYLVVDLDLTLQPKIWISDKTEDLHKALVLGIKDYFQKSGFKKACLGISGGIDSALVACLAVEALGSSNVLGITMPSRYSSTGSIDDSKILAQNLGIELLEIPIESPFNSYLELLKPYFSDLPEDATEENMQARIRGMILMAFSNKFGHIVLSTGNKSEMAMGYATLYGDMCGGLGVINDVTKAQVYSLARFINKKDEIIPQAIIDKPPSAELKPNQKDSDSLPDYSIIDTVLFEYIEKHLSPSQIAQKHGLDNNLVESLVQRIHRNEYKRRQSPPGLRISEKAFSVGRHFPIIQRFVN